MWFTKFTPRTSLYPYIKSFNESKQKYNLLGLFCCNNNIQYQFIPYIGIIRPNIIIFHQDFLLINQNKSAIFWDYFVVTSIIDLFQILESLGQMLS